MPPLDPEEAERAREAAEERKLLNQIRVRSFTVSPASITPFQQATLAWNVFVPASVSSQLVLEFKVGDIPVAATGSLVVSPLVTGALSLSVQSQNSSRVLGSQVVHVDAGGCQTFQIPLATIERESQKVKDLFLAGSITSRGELAVQMLPPDGARLEAPLKAIIENFFDAELEVVLDIRISVANRPGGVRVAAARLEDVSVDVVFHLVEHIVSLGLATAAQAIMQPLAEDLTKAFLGPQIEREVARPLQAIINGLLELFRNGDPEKRVHRLYSITANTGGLLITCCPVPKPPPNPSPGTTFPGSILTGTTLTGTATPRVRRRPKTRTVQKAASMAR